MNMRGLSGVAILAAIVLAPGLGGSSEDKISENAKAFQAEIETMTGQPPQKVLDKLLSWKFELMSAWKTEDPASPDFKKLNKGKTRFTKKEIAELLVPGRDVQGRVLRPSRRHGVRDDGDHRRARPGRRQGRLLHRPHLHGHPHCLQGRQADPRPGLAQGRQLPGHGRDLARALRPRSPAPDRFSFDAMK